LLPSILTSRVLLIRDVSQCRCVGGFDKSGSERHAQESETRHSCDVIPRGMDDQHREEIGEALYQGYLKTRESRTKGRHHSPARVARVARPRPSPALSRGRGTRGTRWTRVIVQGFCRSILKTNSIIMRPRRMTACDLPICTFLLACTPGA
jgi:hypothetical protein